MNCRCSKYLRVSICKKQLMGITGLLLCGFLVSHLTGNLLIYKSAEAFNQYAYFLEKASFTKPAEVVLLLIFFTHLFLAVKLTLENKAARPEKYFMKKNTGRGTTFASSTMPYTGMLTLIFMVLHIYNFKFCGHEIVTTYDGVTMRDFFSQLSAYFKNPLYVTWYVLAVISLGIHVSHGFWSAFQSLGLDHPKYTPTLKILAKVYACIIVLGFSSFPIYFLLQGGH